MDTLFQRYRNLTILAAVLFAQVLVLAFQVRRPTEAGPIRLTRYWAVAAITPLEKAVVHTQQGIGDVWHNYLWLRGVRTENDQLKNENERLRLEQIRLAQDAAQARRLQALLGFKEQTVSETVAAQVIGSSGSETSRTIYIDKGQSDGVRADMAVITSEGVIGKVLKTFPSSSQVLLLTDPTSGVGAILSNSRLQGILKGTPAGELLLHYVMSDEKVQPGEQVLTSGGDRVFPKGMPLGTVTQVSPGPDLFLNIRVKPAAQISKLEEVLVITKVAESTPVVDTAQGGPVRAADILAQRLPTFTVAPPPAEGAKKQADPPTFTEWLRQQKAAQAAAKQGTAAPAQSLVAPKNPAGSAPPSGASAPKTLGTTNTAPKAGGPPPSAGTSAPKSTISAPKQSPVPGTSSPATTTTAAPKKSPSATQSDSTPAAGAAAAPKKAAPRKQPSETPASPPSQPPATPPGVTL